MVVRRRIPVLRLGRACGEISSVSGRAAGSPRRSSPLEERWTPEMDICEKEDRVVIEVELPGIEPADISLLVYHNRIELQGEKKQERHAGPARYHRLERPSGEFRRLVALPAAVLPEKTRAVLENGVLAIVLVKAGKKSGEPREGGAID